MSFIALSLSSYRKDKDLHVFFSAFSYFFVTCVMPSALIRHLALSRKDGTMGLPHVYTVGLVPLLYKSCF